MHTVAVLVFDGVVAFDVAVPLEVFGRTTDTRGGPAYRLITCAPGRRRTVDAGAFALRASHSLAGLAEADTVVVPGVDEHGPPVPAAVLRALRAAAARGTRIASVCAGALILAETGLLDGRRATTHWAAAATLARRHPAVRVDPDVLYVDEGQLLTSAGAAAGLDLCLHLVRRDHGATVAAAVARLAVLPLERAGGQAQFVDHPPPAPDGASLAPLLAWLAEHHAEDLDLAAIAAQVGLSPRTLHRRFAEQTGATPLQWLHRVRLHRAQQLLESTDTAVEQIAGQVGYAAPTTFRERFRRHLGTSPQDYRRAFREKDR